MNTLSKIAPKSPFPRTLRFAFLLTALTLACLPAIGGGHEKDSTTRTTARELRQTILDFVEFPAGLQPPVEGAVCLQFRISDDLELRVIDVSGDHPELNRHVFQMVDGRDLSRFAGLRGLRVKIRIRFRGSY